jgi:hypothetical protein
LLKLASSEINPGKFQSMLVKYSLELDKNKDSGNIGVDEHKIAMTCLKVLFNRSHDHSATTAAQNPEHSLSFEQQRDELMAENEWMLC